VHDVDARRRDDIGRRLADGSVAARRLRPIPAGTRSSLVNADGPRMGGGDSLHVDAESLAPGAIVAT